MADTFAQSTHDGSGRRGRRTRLASATAIAASLICVAAPSLAADNFCKQLNAIVADAPNGFDNFRGALTKQEASTVDTPPVMEDYYAANNPPDGAVSCAIQRQDVAESDGRRIPNYTCEFPNTGKNKNAGARTLANRAAACLGNVSRPSGMTGYVSFHTNDYAVSFTALSGGNSPNVVFMIQSDRR
jgi:hypothetical protein